MGILAGFMVPHPPLIIPEIGKGEEKGIQQTIDAYRKAAQEIGRLEPETIVLLSPHQTMYADYFHISPGRSAKGDFGQFRAPQVHMEADYDTAFVEHLGALAGVRSLQAGTLGERDRRLDHGTMVPLYFVNQFWPKYRLVRIGLSGFPLVAHYRLGQCIREIAEKLDRRTVVIASGDLSHRLKEDGPYGYQKEGPEYDARIMDVMGRGAFGELFSFPEDFCEKAAECGHRSFTILAGALDKTAVETTRLSYEGPFGVGYGICTYHVQGMDCSRNFLEQYEAAERERLREQRKKEDPYVRLARRTIEEYVRTGKRPALPPGSGSLNTAEYYARANGQAALSPTSSDNLDTAGYAGTETRSAKSGWLPEHLPDELYRRRAGVFVSLKEDGKLRGCIGTIQAVRSCLAEEIIYNAVSACSEDPRFSPVEEWEVPRLTITVDVLGNTETISSPEELDVARYGVIVTKGGRHGLLLPNLEGVDTVEQQIAIAKQKAGIKEHEKVALERFEVVRHY